MFSPSAIQRQRFQKVILIFLFLLLSVALIITWNTPATGYESSIYRSTPLILWVSLITSVIVGIILVVMSIVKKELDRSSLWKVGFLLVFLCYTICLALFIIRGYYMWCMYGDPAEHIGWIKETLSAGHIAGGVIYPIIHIYLSEIVFLTDLDLVVLHKIVPVIFSVLFILYMFVFAKVVFSNTAAALLVGIVSCSIFSTDFYLNLIPNGLSSLLSPLALFVIFKYLYQRRLAWAVPLSILVILYPVFHPVSTMFIGLVFLTLWIPHTIPVIVRYVHERRITVPDLKNYRFELILPLLVMLTWFTFWISSFGMWDNTLRSIFQTIFSEGTPSEAMDLMDTISYAQGYGYSVIEIGIKQYGVLMVLFALSVLAVLLLLKNLYHGRYNRLLLALLGPFGVLSIVMPVLFLFDLPFNAFRFLHAFELLMSILSAYALYTILTYKREPLLLRGTVFAAVFVIVIILGLFLGGLLNLYPSPYNLGQSYHNTHKEVVGMKYVYDHRDVTTPLTGISTAPGRLANALLTLEGRTIQRLPPYFEEQDRTPWHFGYDTHSSLSAVYGKEKDLAVISQDRVLYTDIFPDMAQHRFTYQDFERLKIDPGVDAIYSNGGFDFFKVTMVF
jgi:hypothetical protein